MAMGPPYPATPQGAAYAAALSRFSLDNGIPMDVLDPRGEADEVIDEMIADFATTPDGMVVWLLIETMADGDISDRDGAASGSDVDASMDAATVLARIARFEELSGVTFSERRADGTARTGRGSGDDPQGQRARRHRLTSTSSTRIPTRRRPTTPTTRRC